MHSLQRLYQCGVWSLDVECGVRDVNRRSNARTTVNAMGLMDETVACARRMEIR